MEKLYSFAGVELAVRAPDSMMYTEERTLAPFQAEQVTDPHRFYFDICESLAEPAGICAASLPELTVYQQGETQVRYIGAPQGELERAYMRVEHRGKEHFVQLRASTYAAGITAKTVLNAIAAEHLIARAGGFVFHSSYIRVGEKAVLFTAPSGTGKSTQAELWRTLRGAEIINGDRSAVRVDESGIFACGLPFAGSSQICKNITLPIAAIVYLGQAPQTSVRRLRGVEAFRRVWEGVSVNIWDREDVARVSETVQRVLSGVPVFHMPCTPDESAVTALEMALREEA